MKQLSKADQRRKLAALRKVYGVRTNRQLLRKALRIALEASKYVDESEMPYKRRLH